MEVDKLNEKSGSETAEKTEAVKTGTKEETEKTGQEFTAKCSRSY